MLMLSSREYRYHLWVEMIGWNGLMEGSFRHTSSPLCREFLKIASTLGKVSFFYTDYLSNDFDAKNSLCRPSQRIRYFGP